MGALNHDMTELTSLCRYAIYNSRCHHHRHRAFPYASIHTLLVLQCLFCGNHTIIVQTSIMMITPAFDVLHLVKKKNLLCCQQKVFSIKAVKFVLVFGLEYIC